VCFVREIVILAIRNKIYDLAAKPSVAIIIVNWNGCKDTIECLNSLIKINSCKVHIIVVDNASTDNSVEELKGKYPDITLLVSNTNLGFTGGNNLGIEKAIQMNCDYVLFLNNDTIVESNFLDILISCCESDNEVGIAVPKIYYNDFPKIIWFAGSYYDKKFNDFPHRGADKEDIGQYEENITIDRAVGCAMLMPQKVLKSVGYFDDRYFMYYEDIDLSLRARKNNYKILFVPSSIIFHKVGRTGIGNNTNYYHGRNKLFLLKNHKEYLDINYFQLYKEYIILVFKELLSWIINKKTKNHTIRAVLDFMNGKTGIQ
jgi:GT2 family glycosyltransferase